MTKEIFAEGKCNRGGRIRTCDLSVPNRAHYQAVLHPVDIKRSFPNRQMPPTAWAFYGGFENWSRHLRKARANELIGSAKRASAVADLLFDCCR